MKPVTLRTRRLVLNQPTVSDRDLIIEYCQDPVFERYMTLPCALRERIDGPLLGAVGWRATGNDIGYWLGAPHRGNGYMTEAVIAVVTYLFEIVGLTALQWECVVGNASSASVARAAGFRYTGESPTLLTFRDDSQPLAWHAVLTADDRERKPGWPTST